MKAGAYGQKGLNCEGPNVFSSQGSLVRVQYRPPTKSMTSSQKKQETEVASQPDGFVYFFISPDAKAIKVGFASNIYDRQAGARTWNYEQVSFEDYFAGNRVDEGRIHDLLAEHRIRREWFWYNDAVADFLEELQDARLVLNLAAGRLPTSRAMPIAACLELENANALADDYVTAMGGVEVLEDEPTDFVGTEYQ